MILRVTPKQQRDFPLASIGTIVFHKKESPSFLHGGPSNIRIAVNLSASPSVVRPVKSQVDAGTKAGQSSDEPITLLLGHPTAKPRKK
jgi:hypothetical protein